MTATLFLGDCLAVMGTFAPDSIDAILTDPPYGLTQGKKGGSGESSLNLASPAGRSRITTGGGFMGMKWDHGIPGSVYWAEALRVAKPGAYLLAFGGTRTFHRLAVAIEDAGWEIRDTIMWVYGTGFPKSLDVGKALSKAGSSEAQQWEGWGTALKPAWEPIIVARKPLVGTVAANVLAYGTGGLNIDGCRVDGAKPEVKNIPFGAWRDMEGRTDRQSPGQTYDSSQGRFPANLIHDGSDEVLVGFPDTSPSTSHTRGSGMGYHGANGERGIAGPADSGSAARFFYCAKASPAERTATNNHPTVKPIALMRYLVRLVTPPGATVLDPFMGSGSTGVAARLEGACFVGIDITPDYITIASQRIPDAVVPNLSTFDFTDAPPVQGIGSDLYRLTTGQ